MEGALELVEEALVGLVRPLVRPRVEVLEQAPLFLAQMARHDDVHEHALVASAEALEHGHTLAAEDDDSAGKLNSRILFTPKTEGVYRIIVTTCDPDQTGNYRLSIYQAPAKKTEGDPQRGTDRP